MATKMMTPPGKAKASEILEPKHDGDYDVKNVEYYDRASTHG